jgi:hypothetical protein
LYFYLPASVMSGSNAIELMLIFYLYFALWPCDLIIVLLQHAHRFFHLGVLGNLAFSSVSKAKFDRLYTILQKNGGTDTKAMGQAEPHFLSDPMSDRKKSFCQLCILFTKNSMVHKDKADMANNPYLMVRLRSEYYTSMSVSSLPTFLISVKNMNLLSSYL